MKPTLILVLGLVLFACSNNKVQEQSQKVEFSNTTHLSTQGSNISFNDYIQTLDRIPLPFSCYSNKMLLNLSTNYNKKGFEKYKHVWSVQPIGILFNESKYIALADYNTSDSDYAIFISTFSKEGNKIDSLSPYSKSGMDIGYEATEYIQIATNKEISVIDSTKRWTLNQDESDIVEGTMKL